MSRSITQRAKEKARPLSQKFHTHTIPERADWNRPKPMSSLGEYPMFLAIRNRCFASGSWFRIMVDNNLTCMTILRDDDYAEGEYDQIIICGKGIRLSIKDTEHSYHGEPFYEED